MQNLRLQLEQQNGNSDACLHGGDGDLVQLIAAVHPFMSNHQCLYPHIPMPGSYSKPVAVCYMTALKLYLTSQYIFTVQADQQAFLLLSASLCALFTPQFPTKRHGCKTRVSKGRKVEVPPQSYFLPT
ncbi:hypothetical protein PAMP_003949 [Pampus punctatissimus]